MMSGSASDLTLINTGTLTGLTTSLLFRGLGSTVTNRGSLIGDVVLTAGIDHFDTVGGRVLGKVIGGAIHMVSDATLQIVENVVVSGSDAIHTTVDYALSDDQFIAVVTLIGAARNRAGNAQSTTLTGNALENTLAANLGNDTLTGLGGGDVLNRGAGNDSLLGGKDADTLDGPSGADRVYGENGDDVLRGRAWADFLDGGADDDRLSGSYAADTWYAGAGTGSLQGGTGSDFLKGGSDADLFIFVSTRDSAASATRDVIALDFLQGVDRIDLSAIDARALTSGEDAFAFIATVAFTAGTTGQLRYLV